MSALGTWDHRSDDGHEILIDPQSAVSKGSLSVYSSASGFRPSLERLSPAGCIAWTRDQAIAATRAGADFLLLPAVDLSSDDLLAIAALNVPWYLNKAIAPAANIRPTGSLSW